MRAKITEECHKLMRYSFIFTPIFENRTIFQPFQKEDQFATNIKIKISQSHQNFATCHSNKPSGQFNKLTLNYNHYQRGEGLGGVLTNVDYSYFNPSVDNLQANNIEDQHLL